MTQNVSHVHNDSTNDALHEYIYLLRHAILKPLVSITDTKNTFQKHLCPRNNCFLKHTQNHRAQCIQPLQQTILNSGYLKRISLGTFKLSLVSIL